MKLFRIALVFLVFLSACNQVDFVATEGSTISLTARPVSVDKNGRSVLTVTGQRDNGAPLADGTVIRFTVDGNLGTVVPDQVETRDGGATATFVAAQRSGVANITAVSGVASDDVDITVGDARAAVMILTADPSGLPIGGGRVDLRAFVRDEDGNPVSGISVFFQTTSGTLASHGQAVETNGSGVAKDVLTTTADATVTASTSISGVTDSIDIQSDVGEPATCGFVISPSSSVAIGQDVFFIDTTTDTDGRVTSSFWNFGDGSTSSGLNVTHRYSEAGSFVVVHTVTDDQGFTSNCTPQTVTVTEGQPPACSFTLSPSGAIDPGTTVFFTDTSTDPDGSIVRSEWDFGDGGNDEGSSVNHTYENSGSFVVTHTVTDDQDLSDTCDPVTVTVNFVGAAPTCSFTFNTPATSFITSFDASASKDNDENNSSIVTYQWDFGDGKQLTTSNPLNSHDYTASGAGSKIVNLTVTDDEGQTANCAPQTVTVPGT